MATSRRPARPPYRWAVIAYDWLYRLWHGLESPASAVGPVLRLEVRRLRRAHRLPDGTTLASGDRVGVLHLNNEHVAALHLNGSSPLAVGLEFRRRLIASLEALAALADEHGPLADVQAFEATTIFHRGLARLGFLVDADGLRWPRLVATYQRALLASVHPAGALRFQGAEYRRARRLWLTRHALLRRYAARRGSSRSA
jgi:hypothetical protein